jgi:protein-tyrosine phosphatase
MDDVVSGHSRRLALQGTPNFRDFGGYRAAGGHRVRRGHLFRSGHLSYLTSGDVERVAGLELDLVCDFRQLEEQRTSPSILPEQRPPRIVSLPIIPGSNERFFERIGAGLGDRGAMFQFMLEINVDFALSQSAAYTQMFEEILAVPDARFLIHCAAGKDRTGFAAAVFLLALGVPEALVVEDYLLTGQYFEPRRELARIRDKYGLSDVPEEGVMPMLEVHLDYIRAALDAIAGNYGSVEAYLAAELGVGPAELAELRRRYLSSD